jgi:hypothetical protein
MKTIRFVIEIFVLAFNSVLLWNHDWRSLLAFWIGTFIVTLLQSIREFEMSLRQKKMVEDLGLNKKQDDHVAETKPQEN